MNTVKKTLRDGNALACLQTSPENTLLNEGEITLLNHLEVKDLPSDSFKLSPATLRLLRKRFVLHDVAQRTELTDMVFYPDGNCYIKKQLNGPEGPFNLTLL